MNDYRNSPQTNDPFIFQKFLKHAALELHYERLKTANANNDTLYYQYAELQYFHKSRAIHYKSSFLATSL